ncbi:MAG: hypothetical protein V7607_5586 [Solirubrobacteraceae bacterium]
MKRSIPLAQTQDGSIREPARDAPIYADVDVLVVGGGPAGIAAAVAAARAGMSTLLVERYGCLGGIWTAGLLNPYFDGSNKGGIASEIIARLDRHGGSGSVQEWLPDRFVATVFDYEAMKYVLDCMAQEAGVGLLLYTQAVATVMDGERVSGVIVENKSGRSAILARVVIDCTGDGDVAYHAGCEYELGRTSDGLMQPMTLQFTVRGFDWSRDPYAIVAKFNRPEDVADIPFDSFAAVPVPGDSDATAIMWTHIHGVDGTNADDLTRAVVEGRRQAQSAMRLFGAARDGLGAGQLLETAMQVGVRETRRIRGEYYLELDDLLRGRAFPDGVCRVTFNVDIHTPDGEELTATPVEPYEIPYRCLIPRGVEHLLVAGRCISGSHEAHGSYRVTGNCVAMGEAAGLAAAEAARAHTDVRDVDGAVVRDLMKQHGANL